MALSRSIRTASLPAVNYRAARRHLRAADPIWARIIDSVGECRLHDRRRATGYEALVRILVGQQISVHAAASIYARLCEPHGGRPPAPAEVLAAPEAELRAAGLSRAKTAYLRDLAGAIESGRLDSERLGELDDAEAIARLTSVKGFGVWTAEVFLVFQLGRPDVLPAGDLGLRRAVRNAWQLAELPSEAALRDRAEPWCPWRSIACWYLWQSLRAGAPA